MAGLHSSFAFVHGELLFNLRAGISRTQKICGRGRNEFDFPSREVCGLGNWQRSADFLTKPHLRGEMRNIWPMDNSDEEISKKRRTLERRQTFSLNSEWLCVRKHGEIHTVEKKEDVKNFSNRATGKKASSQRLWLGCAHLPHCNPRGPLCC